jgi:hypothetical protein
MLNTELSEDNTSPEAFRVFFRVMTKALSENLKDLESLVGSFMTGPRRELMITMTRAGCGRWFHTTGPLFLMKTTLGRNDFDEGSL